MTEIAEGHRNESVTQERLSKILGGDAPSWSSPKAQETSNLLGTVSDQLRNDGGYIGRHRSRQPAEVHPSSMDNDQEDPLLVNTITEALGFNPTGEIHNADEQAKVALLRDMLNDQREKTLAGKYPDSFFYTILERRNGTETEAPVPTVAALSSSDLLFLFLGHSRGNPEDTELRAFSDKLELLELQQSDQNNALVGHAEDNIRDNEDRIEGYYPASHFLDQIIEEIREGAEASGDPNPTGKVLELFKKDSWLVDNESIIPPDNHTMNYGYEDANELVDH